MAKKLIAIVMALALVLSFAACGGKGDDTTPLPKPPPIRLTLSVRRLPLLPQRIPP